jgi:hypothetical protein
MSEHCARRFPRLLDLGTRWTPDRDVAVLDAMSSLNSTAVTHLVPNSFLNGRHVPISTALLLVHRSFPWTTSATNPSNPRQ